MLSLSSWMLASRNCLRHVGVLKLPCTTVVSYITAEGGLFEVELELVKMEGWHRRYKLLRRKGYSTAIDLIGASYIDEKLVAYLQQQDCPGILFREALFKQVFRHHHKRHPDAHPGRTALTLIAALRKLYPDKFRWRQDGKSLWLNFLVGNHIVREMLSKGATADEVMASWQNDVVSFGATRSKYLLYN